MTSPSNTSSNLSTPWVEGCWGPMLTVSSSRLSPTLVATICFPCHGEIGGLRAERFGAAQGMAAPVVGQHDAPQIGAALKLDTEHDEELALAPVGAGHERGDAGGKAVGVRLQPQPGPVLE